MLIFSIVGFTLSTVVLLLLIPSWFDADEVEYFKSTVVAAVLSVTFAGSLLWARFRLDA